jgi:hypothetical protein
MFQAVRSGTLQIRLAFSTINLCPNLLKLYLSSYNKQYLKTGNSGSDALEGI